jgi:hypothetical protein
MSQLRSVALTWDVKPRKVITKQLKNTLFNEDIQPYPWFNFSILNQIGSKKYLDTKN